MRSKATHTVGTRSQGPSVPADYEIPRNAVRRPSSMPWHRDYTSNAGVQVMLFADRLEVPHVSIPRNPLIREPMFLARYMEKAGSG